MTTAASIATAVVVGAITVVAIAAVVARQATTTQLDFNATSV
jgi:hypothetical protein